MRWRLIHFRKVTSIDLFSLHAKYIFIFYKHIISVGPMEAPRLIDYGAKNYMSGILNRCHENRVNIYLYVFNFTVLLLFFLVVGFTLYYCHKTKMTPEEAHAKYIKDQEYVLSKIRFYKHHQQTMSSKASITGLPM